MKTIKFEEAIKILKKRIEGRIPAGAELRDSPTTGGFLVSAELAWGVDASLRVSPWFDEVGGKPVLKLMVAVSWSSPTIAPSTARVAAMLHTEMADLACLLEALIANLPKIEIGKRAHD